MVAIRSGEGLDKGLFGGGRGSFPAGQGLLPKRRGDCGRELCRGAPAAEDARGKRPGQDRPDPGGLENSDD